jgi:hypothetical protein
MNVGFVNVAFLKLGRGGCLGGDQDSCTARSSRRDEMPSLR